MTTTEAQSGATTGAPSPQGVSAPGLRLWRAGLVLLVVATLGLRLAGIEFLLPQNTESDGGVIVRQVALIEEGSDDPWREDNWSYYPHLVARTVAWTSHAEVSTPKTVEEHLASAAAPNLRVRQVVAWLSLLVIPATWWIARRFFPPAGAFLAAAFVALSHLFLCFAQESRAHAPAAALAALAVAACLRVRARPSIANHALAGAACGLALGALQSGVATLIPLVAAHVLREGERRRRDWFVLALAFVPVALAFVLFHPFTFSEKPVSDAPELYVRPDGNVQFYGHTVFLGMFNGAGFASVWRTLAGFEPLLLALALLGVALWCARSRRSSKALFVALAYAVPYLVVIGLYERTYERFVLQLVPFLACAAVIPFVAFAGDRGPRAGFRKIFAVAFAVVALLPSAALGLVLVTRRDAPDTAERAATWIAEHVPAGERVAIVPFVDVPLLRDDAALAEAEKLGWASPWLAYQLRERARLPVDARFDLRTLPLGRKKQRDAALADPLGYLQGCGARWVLVPVTGAETTDESFRVLRRALVEHARCAAIFSARKKDRGPARVEDLPLDVGDTSSWWRRNWTLSLARGHATIGDVLEIWELPKP